VRDRGLMNQKLRHSTPPYKTADPLFGIYNMKFIFKINNHIHFEGILHCSQCIGNTTMIYTYLYVHVDITFVSSGLSRELVNDALSARVAFDGHKYLC
jgi:hypothetical protein